MEGERRLGLRLFIRAKDERAVRTVLRRVERALARPLAVEVVERYAKDPALHVVEAATPLGSVALADGVVEALQLVSRVAHRTDVGFPEEHDGAWSFEGQATTAHGFTVSGVELLIWWFAG